MKRRKSLIVLGVAVIVIVAGWLLPERRVIPVARATTADWNHGTFWAYPWGASVTHKGIDIFAPEGTPVVSAGDGIVVFRGALGLGGQVAIALGPKWRFHYYAHLARIDARWGQWLSPGEQIGVVGTTGNAAGRPPHLHYSIFTPIPYPWLYRPGHQSYLRPFFVNPHEQLEHL